MLKNKRAADEDEEMDITPMIDVTFLLLIFFMVTSNMERGATLAIPPAKHGLGITKDNAVILTIFKTDDTPEVYLADGEKENGPASMEEVTAYVNLGVKENKYQIIIKADRDIPSGFVEEVARAANDVESDAELKFFVGIEDKQE